METAPIRLLPAAPARAAPAPRRPRPTATAASAPALAPQPLPRWVTAAVALPAQSVPDQQAQAMGAGAALFAFDAVIRAAPPWLACLRQRLALQASVAACRLLRLPADEADLRDAEHLTRPGDDPGPAGRLYRLLRRFTEVQLSGAAAALALIASQTQAAANGAEVVALLEADCDLAARLGWAKPLALHLMAIFDPRLKRDAAGMRPRANSAEWPEVRTGVLAQALVGAQAQAVTLARRADALQAAATRLRTRDDGRGAALILADDCVAPWRMAQAQGFGSDRAARRLCESLHAMGALRLLTARPTFRLYGL